MIMHTSIFKFTLTALFAATVLAACATQTPILDDHFGEAVNAAKAQQIINPDAGREAEAPAGIDGQAANAAVDRYHRSFVQPPVTPNVFNIGVGSSGSSGGTSGSGSTTSGTR